MDYKVVVDQSIVRWMHDEPDQAKVAALEIFLLDLLDADPPLGIAIPGPGEDPYTLAWLADTELMVEFAVVPEFERIFVDWIYDFS